MMNNGCFKIKEIALFTPLLLVLSLSCKKEKNITVEKASIIAQILNPDGSFFYNDTFLIKYLGDNCAESNNNDNYSYSAYSVYDNYEKYIYCLKNSISVKNYSVCLPPDTKPTKENEYNLLLRRFSSGTEYFAKNGTLTIHSIAPFKDWMMGSGIIINGSWEGTLLIKHSSGNNFELPGKLFIHNMEYYQ